MNLFSKKKRLVFNARAKEAYIKLIVFKRGYWFVLVD